LWDRLLRKIDARDEDHEVDASILSFHLLFIVPISREYARLHGSRRGEHYLADRRRARGEPLAANEDLIGRADKIVKGTDPILLRK